MRIGIIIHSSVEHILLESLERSRCCSVNCFSASLCDRHMYSGAQKCGHPRSKNLLQLISKYKQKRTWPLNGTMLHNTFLKMFKQNYFLFNFLHFQNNKKKEKSPVQTFGKPVSLGFVSQKHIVPKGFRLLNVFFCILQTLNSDAGRPFWQGICCLKYVVLLSCEQLNLSALCKTYNSKPITDSDQAEGCRNNLSFWRGWKGNIKYLITLWKAKTNVRLYLPLSTGLTDPDSPQGDQIVTHIYLTPFYII